MVAAGLALLAGFVRTCTTRGEAGSRYRTATLARLSVAAVAVSYVAILIALRPAYHPTAAGFDPDSSAVLVSALRYMDWFITVLLLTVASLGVCVSVSVRASARRRRMIAMGGAFLTVSTDFLGAFVFSGSSNNVMMLPGAISTLFWVITTVVLVRAVRHSLPRLTPEPAALFRSATILLLSGWIVYPVVYLTQVPTGGGCWPTAVHITLCIADVAIRIGFGGPVHRVAKLRRPGRASRG